MRTFNATVYAILLATVLLSAKAFAQLENVGVCGHVEEESSQMLMKTREQYYKPLFIEPNPTGMDFKVAVLYFKAANDTFMARGSIYSDSLRCLVEQWDASSAAPSWMGELLIPTAFNFLSHVGWESVGLWRRNHVYWIADQFCDYRCPMENHQWRCPSMVH